MEPVSLMVVDFQYLDMASITVTITDGVGVEVLYEMHAKHEQIRRGSHVDSCRHA